MNKERLAMLDGYIRSGMSPILLEDIPANIFENAVIIDANCDISLLNGHYEGFTFRAPDWYYELTNNKDKPAILIIDNINQLKLDKQTKFIEILKYKKISTFDLPRNCFIIVTATNLEEKPISEEVYSLMVHI